MKANTYTETTPQTESMTAAQRNWMIAGIAMLSIRFIQGFIYWGGGSRRFIYAPSKLDPNAPQWMANKFQTAMPGALFGTDHLISYMLQHFYLLYIGVILFSAAELISGAMLMVGFMTRASALVTMGMSVILMAMFGWQGATCIDEWTMAACNLAMGTTLFLAGSSAYSVDNLLLKQNAAWKDKTWFRWMSGALPLPQSDKGFLKLAMILFAFVVVYNVGTYSHFRGSVIGAFHSGPVSPTKHHVTLTDGVLLKDGSVRVHAYLDAGTPEAPLHLVAAALTSADHRVLEQWNAKDLSSLSKDAFANDYAYNKFGTGAYGIVAPMGAAASITFKPSTSITTPTDATSFQVIDVNGRSFTTPLTVEH